MVNVMYVGYTVPIYIYIASIYFNCSNILLQSKRHPW